MKITEIAHHRNGVGGNSFYAVSFKDGREPMVGIVFEGSGNVAVLDAKMASEGVVTFGKNSWRGDRYEAQFRAACEAWEDARSQARGGTAS